MKVVDTIHLSIESFKNRKSRTFLTILGVSIGIGAVLFLVSLGYGLQKILIERITTAESFLTLDIAVGDHKIISINDDSIAKILKVEHVKKVSPQSIIPAQLTFNNLTSETIMNVVDEDFFILSGKSLALGSSWKSSTTDVVVSNRVADLFNLKKEELVSKKIKLIVVPNNENKVYVSFNNPANQIQNNISVKTSTKSNLIVKQEPSYLWNLNISGVISDDQDANQVYVLKSSLPDISILEYQSAKVRVDDIDNLDVVRQSLLSMGFTVSSISDTVDQANKIFTVVQFALGIFGVIAVIVAAISLANTMTISLLERTQDIGVMRSIGGSGLDIQNLFLIEATVMGFAGGILGILLGYILSIIVNLGMRVLALSLGGNPVNLFSTPLWFLIFIIVFSTSVGLIAGFFPARRAGKLDPLRALRYK